MAQMDALALEAAEEVFGHGVVIGIALAGHALPDAEAGETLTAVSYTHLDVYKRQAVYLGKCISYDGVRCRRKKSLFAKERR